MKRTRIIVETSIATRFVVEPDENDPRRWSVQHRRTIDGRDEAMRLEGFSRGMTFATLTSALGYVDTFFRGRGLTRCRSWWSSQRRPPKPHEKKPPSASA